MCSSEQNFEEYNFAMRARQISNKQTLSFSALIQIMSKVELARHPPHIVLNSACWLLRDYSNEPSSYLFHCNRE